MQSLQAKTQYRNSLHCAYRIFTEEGVTRFWKGTVPRLGRLIVSFHDPDPTSASCLQKMREWGADVTSYPEESSLVFTKRFTPSWLRLCHDHVETGRLRSRVSESGIMHIHFYDAPFWGRYILSPHSSMQASAGSFRHVSVVLAISLRPSIQEGAD